MQAPFNSLNITSGRGSPDVLPLSGNLETTINRYAPVSVGGVPSGADNDKALEDEVERMAARDPIAAQVWRMYARTKATLPHAQRMENLTWRMMTMALKKRNEEEGKSRDAVPSSLPNFNFESGAPFPFFRPSTSSLAASIGGTKTNTAKSDSEAKPPTDNSDFEAGPKTEVKDEGRESQGRDSESRGRRPDKAIVRVVGFEGKSQDGEEAE